jgi:hypothetical protein
VSENLSVRPELTAVLQHRKASSDCHAAPLGYGAEEGTYTCTRCGQPCGRVLGPPAEVTAHG